MSELKASYLGLAKYLYFIGESHVLPYRNVLFQPAPTSDIFLGRVRFLQILAARFSGNGAVHPDILRALQAEQLLSDKNVAAHLANDRQSTRVAEVSGIAANVPCLTLFAGDLDVSEILRRLGADYDFELPDDPGYGVNPALELVPFATLHDQINGIFQPFLAGCRLLHELGFTRLMIHALPPRVRDTRQQAWSGVRAESQVRAKTTVLANRTLSGIAEALGVPFIETWPQVTEDGYLKPEFCLDGIHLNRAAALLSLRHIVERLD